MLLFIALPIISVAYQSLFIEHEQILIEVENCGPFGCTRGQRRQRRDGRAAREPAAGRFNGLGTYTNASHLAFERSTRFVATSENFGEIRNRIMNLPFYKALIFTLTYTFIVTPLVIILGFIIAVVVNSIPQVAQGSGDLLLASADARDAAGRLAGPVLDDRQRAASSAPRCKGSSTIPSCR